MAKKPVHEIELDDEIDDDVVEYAYAKCMVEVSEILSGAYQAVEAKVRALVDELKEVE